MLSFIKFLKIALPVATVTSATIATTFLVSSSRNDLSNKGKEEDSILTDFVNLVEDFEEKKLFYAKQGDGDGTVALGEEESEKLQKLIDQGADINDTGNRSDNVPDAAGTSSSKPDTQMQRDQAPSAMTETKDGIDQEPSVKAQSSLNSEGSYVSDSSLIPEKNESDLDDTSGKEEGEDMAGSKGVVDGKEDEEQKDQSLSEPEDIKNEASGPSDSPSAEPSLEINQQLQKSENIEEGEGDSHTQEENSQKGPMENGSPQTQDSKEEAGSPETVSDVPKDDPDSLGEKKENEKTDRVQESSGADEATGGSSNQHQGNEHGDSLGNSDETRVNLEELQKLEGELGSARDALSALLSRL